MMNKNTEIENLFSCQWVNLAAWICPVDESHQISILWSYVHSSSHWKWSITCLISEEGSRSGWAWALLGWATSENPQVWANDLRCFSRWSRLFTPLDAGLLGAVSPDCCDLRGGPHRWQLNSFPLSSIKMSGLEKIIEARKDNSKADTKSRLAGEETRVGLCSQIHSVFNQRSTQWSPHCARHHCVRGHQNFRQQWIICDHSLQYYQAFIWNSSLTQHPEFLFAKCGTLSYFCIFKIWNNTLGLLWS